jgi:hypothetical protein
LNIKVKAPACAAGAFCSVRLCSRGTNLETREEDAAIPVIGFQVVVQAGLLP